MTYTPRPGTVAERALAHERWREEQEERADAGLAVATAEAAGK